MRVLYINRSNNMGDCMCQVTAMKEWKDRNPGAVVDFISCFNLHWTVANHAGNVFDKVMFEPNPDLMYLPGYDQFIEFKIDWGNAVANGILRSWCETTLGFVPTTDVPYFLLTEEEKLTAKINLRQIMYVNFVSEEAKLSRFRKSVIIQPEAVSDGRRSFQPQDWQRLIDLFPKDVALIYFCPISRLFETEKLLKGENLIILPGYPIGYAAAMMQLVDCVFTVHSGTVMLAHAVNAKNIVHINFLEMSGRGILNVKDGEDVFFESNMNVDWNVIQELISKYVA